MSPSQPEAGIPPLFSLIGRCCPFFNAIYLAGDHVVLAKQAGIISSSDVAARAQKYSLLAWLASSVCGAAVSHARIASIKARKRDEDNEQRKARLRNQDREKLKKANCRLIMNVLQALLAIALLRGSTGKFTGLVGTIASALHVYVESL